MDGLIREVEEWLWIGYLGHGREPRSSQSGAEKTDTKKTAKAGDFSGGTIKKGCAGGGFLGGR